MTSSNQAITHLGLIPDGNRRWAQKHGLPKLEGYKRGYELLKDIAQKSFDRGISYVSAYVFSTENWNREDDEVSYLMELSLKMLKRDMKQLGNKNIRIRVIGSRDKLQKEIVAAITQIEDITSQNTGGTLCLCFNYGGRDEIIEAVQKLAKENQDSGKSINEENLKANMYSHDIPAPDMIVRTSGEQRLSNFLLWDSAYAELCFLPIFWPEFSESTLDEVISEYNSRKRNFGA